MKRKILMITATLLLLFSGLGIKANAAQEDCYKLKSLPYSYEALEPYIDKETMILHHDKHQGAYVDKLNKAISKHPELCKKSVKDLLKDLDSIPKDIREDVKNNGGGVFNHDFFWSIMGKDKGGEPKGELKEKIDKEFGSFENFKAKFKEEGTNRFGSGWVWLLKDKDDKLTIVSTPNQDVPAFELKPIIAIDVWEHAYYLKYKNKRGEYIDNWWNVVNWDNAEENYKGLQK